MGSAFPGLSLLLLPEFLCLSIKCLALRVLYWVVPSLLALIVSRVKCLYQRDEDGQCSPKCGCMSAPLEDHHEILVDKQEIQGVEVLILSKK